MGGKAIIVSAPSGSGKTTIVRSLIEQIPTLQFSISATTRSRRPNEIDTQDYYFLTSDSFRKKISDKQFLEWEEVYEGTFYGTLTSEVERIWSNGNDVIFDVDVKGGLRLKNKLGSKALSLFIRVPSLQVLEDRLRSRSTEDKSQLEMRIKKASMELMEEPNFDEVIVNEDLDTAIRKATKLVSEFTV